MHTITITLTHNIRYTLFFIAYEILRVPYQQQGVFKARMDDKRNLCTYRIDDINKVLVCH